MRAELKGLYSSGVDDLELFAPTEPTHFALLVRACVGPVGTISEETFDIMVCSPSWIEEEASRVEVFSPRHHLVMARFNYKSLRVYIEKFCNSCRGANWDQVGLMVSRLGFWEFEDYNG